ncbi:MAG: flagellar assembly peptidoglycan hydrolase FlgJ [Azoarcus sp.]|nr:flagellar assembly peptidoglycan hydrolase FlgJ [Azoarcus sp.]
MNANIQLNAFDPNSLGDLKKLARTDGQSDETLRAAAKQFEALFLQMVMKSMRDATPTDSMMDNEQSKMYQGMLDQQLSLNLSQSKGAGLSEVIFRQIGGGKGKVDAIDGLTGLAGQGTDSGFSLENVPRRAAISAARSDLPGAVGSRGQGVAGLLDELNGTGVAATGATGSVSAAESAALAAKLADAIRGARETSGAASQRARDFVADVWPHAVEASRKTGIPAHFMVAQAALETGWGEKQLKNADGSPSHNLFNIKAGSSWGGRTTEVQVTEYAGDRAYNERARFRSYASYAESFGDYARLMSSSPRYAGVLGQTDAAGFARGLQQAGYATDPMYADKLTRIIGGSTLRNALLPAG